MSNRNRYLYTCVCVCVRARNNKLFRNREISSKTCSTRNIRSSRHWTQRETRIFLGFRNPATRNVLPRINRLPVPVKHTHARARKFDSVLSEIVFRRLCVVSRGRRACEMFIVSATSTRTPRIVIYDPNIYYTYDVRRAHSIR